MRSSTLLFTLFRFFLPPALIATVLLYTYPAVQSCAFPYPAPSRSGANNNQQSCFLDSKSNSKSQTHQTPVTQELAPFRLLALGDPQLEGSTSLPDPLAPWFPTLTTARTRLAFSGDKPATLLKIAREVAGKDVVTLLQALRKKLDLLGNDFYLAHIFWLMRWWTAPTHVVVLGDLLGSQWITDGEFESRTRRFWDRVFKGAGRVPDEVTGLGGGDGGERRWGDTTQVLGEDQSWSARLVTVAGNHDVGYAGDIDSHRIERFETAFGAANWVVRFQLPFDEARDRGKVVGVLGGVGSTAVVAPPALDVVVLNSMNLDSPAWQTELQAETHEFLDEMVRREKRSQDATVLLTHIPLFKEEGVCVDGPFFNYFPEEQGGGIKEQNHLSQEMSWKILDGLFDAHGGIVVNGHDHEGCNVLHHRHALPATKDEDRTWKASRYRTSTNTTSDEYEKIREITVRSMMGSYGGNAGLLSAWFDDEDKEWRFEYRTCVLGVQHIWWAVHAVDIVVILLGLFGVEALRQEWAAERREEDKRLEEERKNKKKI